ncbi:MAG: SGNH/GDSL hydrolase family protein, partial [Planctomycetota bacterium]
MMLKTKIIFLAFLCISVQVIADDGIIIRKNQRTLEQIEHTYSEMPPVEYRPPSDRLHRLPLTKQRLTEGGTLRVVMLGDSIVNDTSRSCWNLLLQRDYPNCKIEKITSVRGSTGCWWYKEAGRVQKYVLDHKPNLVIIGGISQRGDIDSIREVIRQIRSSCQADILLMTGAFGQVDPSDESQWKKISNPGHFSDYRKELEKLAIEVGAAFLDMEAAWAEYIRQCGKDLEWFKRDPIHANEHGEQIIGRILAKYVSPSVADADSPKALDIGSRLELFVDDFLIEQMEEVNLTLHRPICREVVIVHDRPWEGNTCGYHTIFKDGDLYRMYYRGWNHDNKTQKQLHKAMVCYAESSDGIHWNRSSLGLVEFDGSKNNNIILKGPGSHNFTPFKDANPNCAPDKRYKAVARGEDDGHKKLFAFQSADGIHWQLMQSEPVITEGAFDSQNLAFWDPVRKEYRCYFRDFHSGVRGIKTSTSIDFIRWTKPVWLQYPGAPKEHLYTN